MAPWCLAACVAFQEGTARTADVLLRAVGCAPRDRCVEHVAAAWGQGGREAVRGPGRWSGHLEEQEEGPEHQQAGQ